MSLLFDWERFLLKRNLRKNLFKNLASFSCAVIGFSVTLLSIGYFSGYDKALSNQGKEALDYGFFMLTEKKKVSVGDSPLKLVETRRPNLESCIDALGDEDVEYGLCFSYFFPDSAQIYFGESGVGAVNFAPVFSFEFCETKKDSLLGGYLPLEESLEVCLVNEAFAKEYPNLMGGGAFSFSKTYTYGENKDTSRFDYRMEVAGVVKDFPFMSTPKVYYSYLALEAFFFNRKVGTLKQSVFSMVDGADAFAPQGSYSRYAFFLSDAAVSNIPPEVLSNGEGLCAYGAIHTSMESFFLLSKSFASSLALFSSVSLAGLIIVLAMNNYAHFTSKKKENAILIALGAKRKQIETIYASEAILICVGSSLFSLLLSWPFSLAANSFFRWKFGLRDIVSIPFFSWRGFPFLLEIILFGFSFLVAWASKIPFRFVKMDDLIEELRDE